MIWTFQHLLSYHKNLCGGILWPCSGIYSFGFCFAVYVVVCRKLRVFYFTENCEQVQQGVCCRTTPLFTSTEEFQLTEVDNEL